MKKPRRKGSRPRSVSIQIRIKVHRPKSIKLTRAFLAEAVRYRIENSEDLPGIKITGIVWENPAKTYVYEDPEEIDKALIAAGRIMKIDPSVFHKVREG